MAITAEQETRFKGYLAELENEEHLWCRHGDKMRELLIIFESKETLSTLLDHMAKQLRTCVNWYVSCTNEQSCTNSQSFHSAASPPTIKQWLHCGSSSNKRSATRCGAWRSFSAIYCGKTSSGAYALRTPSTWHAPPAALRPGPCRRLCEGFNSIDARSESADLVALAFLYYEILHFPQAIQNSAQLSELFAKR